MNGGPTCPLEHRIRQGVRSGKEVKLLHLRVFGCIVYAHISDQGRNNLEPKFKKYTFIGYGKDEFGYRTWDDENKKVICNKDVIFYEGVMYKEKHKTDANNLGQSWPTYVDVDDVPNGPIMKQVVESTQ